MDIEEFRLYAKNIIDFICDQSDGGDGGFHKHISQSLKQNLLKRNNGGASIAEAPRHSESFDKIFYEFKEKLFSTVMSDDNRQSYDSNPNAFPIVLADMLSSALGSIGFSWASCPAATELEIVVLNWYAKALNLPNAFLHDPANSSGGGVLQSSTTECILVSMIAARTHRFKKLRACKSKINPGEFDENAFIPKLVAYASETVNPHVVKAAKLALMNLHLIKTDNDGCMRIDCLKLKLAKDTRDGLIPCFVLATVGTKKNVKALDDLMEIGNICKSSDNIWFHVDGSNSGNLLLLPEFKKYTEGLEFADSFNVEPAKAALADNYTAAMWVRDVDALKSAFNVDPLYLRHEYDETTDFRHYGIPLSRRFRAIQLWFAFRIFGLDKLRAEIRLKLEKSQDSDHRRNVCLELENYRPIRKFRSSMVIGSPRPMIYPSVAYSAHLLLSKKALALQ